MGQKVNTLTLKKESFFLNNLNSNNRIFLSNYQILKVFKRLLFKKNILITKTIINFSSNKIFLRCNLFFRSKKLQQYNKKIRQKVKFSPIKKNLNILNIFNKIKKKFNIIGTSFSYLILNHFLNKRLYFFLFKKFKVYKSSLFEKGFNLFLDFLKILTFYFCSLVPLETLGVALGQTFKFLKKKRHGKYFIFIKHIFFLITNKLVQKKYNTMKINGVKLLISGRLKGKSKKSKMCIKQGIIGTQSLNRNIDFCKSNVFSMRYGVFGLKL